MMGTAALAGSGEGQRLDRLPLSFEANLGQGPADVRYLSGGRSPGLHFRAGARVSTVEGVEIRLAGAAEEVEPEGLEELAGRSHYLLGSDARRWRRNVPHFGRVRYRDVYPGISLEFHGKQRELEYDFLVAPGADHSRIRMAFDGAAGLQLEANGDLLIQGRGATLVQRRPQLYQETGGMRCVIEGRYRLEESGEVSIRVGAYDAGQELVIDPILSYSTYLGGTGGDRALAVAVDGGGNAYVTGVTSSRDFPRTADALQSPATGRTDVFVTKVNPSGTALVYSTFIGGSDDDGGYGIAVDSAGNAYVTGRTRSSPFPTTAGALRTARNGFGDAFVLKLNPAGSALVYSTYLGGRGENETGMGIAVDAAGAAFVGGRTDSSDFPTTPGAFRTTAGGGSCGFLGFTFPCDDGFVSKLNAAGSALVYSTYVGGSGDDQVQGIAVDSSGNAYVTGFTEASNFPTTAGVLQTARRGGSDAFVVKLNTTGGAVYSTYLGGGDAESGEGIAADSGGHAYVAGSTASSNFPTAGAAQAALGGSTDAFLAKLNPAGNGLVYATYWGGSAFDQANAIAIDGAGNAYATGSTNSANFPAANAVQPASGGGNDAFAMQLEANGSRAVLSTYLGGSGGDFGYGIALDGGGGVIVAGGTESANLFTTQGAAQTAYRGGSANDVSGDAFVMRIADLGASGITMLSAASFSGTAFAAEMLVSAFGERLATATALAETTPLPAELAGTTVRVTDAAGVERVAPLIFVSPGQVNFLLPAGTGAGIATITVRSGDGTQTTSRVRIEPVAPGLFSANADGKGVAAALSLRVRGDGTQVAEPIFRFDAAQSKRVAVPIDLRPQEEVYLLLFGTGIRNRSAVSAVSVRIAGIECEVLSAGAQGEFAGLDQVNVRLPRSLIGRAESDLILTVDGKAANTVTVFLEGRPRITAVSPSGVRLGETVNELVISGENLGEVTRVQIEPAAGITVSNLRATDARLTVQVSAAAETFAGERRISGVFAAGTTDRLPFLVRPRAGSRAPFIYNFQLRTNAPAGDMMTFAGSFDFEDEDGDVAFTGGEAGSARMTYSVGGCSRTFTGTFLDKRGQTSGRVTFTVEYRWNSLIFSSSRNSIVLVDAAGNRSNSLETPDQGGFCRLQRRQAPPWDAPPAIDEDRRRRRAEHG